MDWQSSNRQDAFRYVRVDMRTGAEVETLTSVLDGGSIEENDLAALKVSGSVPYVESLDIGNDYLRIYLDATLGSDSASVALGTFLVSTPELTLTDTSAEGTADLYSLLQILAEDVCDAPHTIAAGTNAIAEAAGIAEAHGLPVVSDDSTAILSNPATFDAGTPWLEIVNWLCDYAGFRSAGVDAYGNVLLYVYRDPSLLTPVFRFADTDLGVNFMPGVRHALDIFDVPNKLVLTMSNQDLVMTSTVINSDPLSRYSTVARGREVGTSDTINDIDSQAALDVLAARKLAEKTSAVESVEVSHPYIPFALGVAIALDYTSHSLSFEGTSVRKAINLVVGAPVNTRLRKFIRS